MAVGTIPPTAWAPPSAARGVARSQQPLPRRTRRRLLVHITEKQACFCVTMKRKLRNVLKLAIDTEKLFDFSVRSGMMVKTPIQNDAKDL